MIDTLRLREPLRIGAEISEKLLNRIRQMLRVGLEGEPARWVRQWICTTFPDKQIYVRAEGRVRFFVVTSEMQAIGAGAATLAFAWVAFTSVNFIFKDQVLAAKGRHFDQMQVSYETRIADLQISYDELNGDLIRAQDRFKAIADSLETRQDTLAALIEQKGKLRTSLGIGKAPAPAGATPEVAIGIGGALETLLPVSASPSQRPFAREAAALAGPQSRPELATPKKPPAVEPRAPWIPQYPAFFSEAVHTLGTLFQRKAPSENVDHPLLKGVTDQSTRVMRLGMAQPELLAGATQDLNRETTRLTRALKTTGIDSQSLLRRVSAAKPVGGPFIPVETSDPSGADEGFSASIAEAAGALERLTEVVGALKAIPLAPPVTEASVSSGFGSRIDPFFESLAFHSGLDFSGRWGSDVSVTAPGVVVFTGRNGAYGNSVEVDHGYGLRTRYGHLAQIAVQPGARLKPGAVIGKLGSTGRSTGPHLHYEVWYDNAARDPMRFIKAGHNVLQE